MFAVMRVPQYRVLGFGNTALFLGVHAQTIGGPAREVAFSRGCDARGSTSHRHGRSSFRASPRARIHAMVGFQATSAALAAAVLTVVVAY